MSKTKKLKLGFNPIMEEIEDLSDLFTDSSDDLFFERLRQDYSYFSGQAPLNHPIADDRTDLTSLTDGRHYAQNLSDGSSILDRAYK